MQNARVLRFFGVILTSGLVLSVSCGWPKSQTTQKPYVLTEKDARHRSAQVQNVRYDISLSLSNRKEFDGKTTIHFDLTKIESPLRVDFFNGTIRSLSINQVPTSKIKYEKGFFMISGNLLEPGPNTIEIQYTHPYSRSGNGLHSFLDPQDQETYIYSQFETNHANAMFPSFDQPDIKATYRLDVEHPIHWKVISAVLPYKVESRADRGHSFFPETQKFSTYVFSLHAGPYEEWKDSYGNIPLRLYARKSMAKYVNPSHWFTITKQGFAFFEKYFEMRYPFGKYDQVIVTEFNFGAMENVGAVTFSERFLSRGKTTRRHQEKLASVILHELAHMWFGNLVTMRWWDGLWLNESFATYLAAKAQFHATEYKESWQTFFSVMKSWAYNADRLTTTHPIQANVADTEEAFTNFDGITYGKGAAVLRQLQFFVGKENFRKGVSHYLKNFAYNNAELKDFLHSIETVSGKNLQKWSADWLETEGYNRVSQTHVCNPTSRTIDTLTIRQDNQVHTRILREHKMQVAFFRISNRQPVLYFTIPIEYRDHETTIDLTAKSIACPDYIVLNYDDYDFVRTEYPSDILSEAGFGNLKTLLTSQTNDHLTLMLWRDLFEEVRDGRFSLADYSNLAMELLPQDPRDIVLESNIQTLTSTRTVSYHSFLYLKKPSESAQDLLALENFAWKNFTLAKPHSDRKRLWLQNYIQVAHTEDFFRRGERVLTGKESLPGFDLDQDIRWSMLKKMCTFKYDDTTTKQLLANEKERDNSRLGLDSALACEAAHPDPVTKGRWMAILTQPGQEFTAGTLRTVMHYVFPIHQKALQIPFVEFFYQSLKEGNISGDENYQEYFSDILAPRFCTEENRHILKKFINNSQRLPVNTLKNLRNALDSEEECLRVRQFSSP